MSCFCHQHAAPDVVRLIAGNKKDLDTTREVLQEQGRKVLHVLDVLSGL